MEKVAMTGNACVDIDILCNALVKIAEAAKAVGETAEAVSKAFSVFGSFMIDESLRRYATDRQ